jgi:hypothetical protein
MTNIPDEMLMAYADNELSAREREELETRLKVNTDLRARLEPFVATGPALAAFFNEPLHEPVPARLIKAVAAAPPSRARGGSRSRALQGGAGWLETIGSFLFPDSPRLAATFGLAALLIAGGAAGWVMGRDSSGTMPPNALVALNRSELVAAGPLLTTLESEPSKTLAGDVPPSRVVPLQSFRSREGTFCREYRAGGTSGQTFSGVACHQPNGTWRIAAHVETPPAGAGSEASGYQTAAGPASETLNAVIDALIEGDVLGAEDEAAAIARKWTPPTAR